VVEKPVLAALVLLQPATLPEDDGGNNVLSHDGLSGLAAVVRDLGQRPVANLCPVIVACGWKRREFQPSMRLCSDVACTLVVHTFRLVLLFLQNAHRLLQHLL
jgi:hypothetical protein